MKLPHAPLYGAFARLWALHEQGISVTVETMVVRHFRIAVSVPVMWNESFLHPEGIRAYVDGDDPDDVLDQIEGSLKEKGVQFTLSREFLEPLKADPNEQSRESSDSG